MLQLILNLILIFCVLGILILFLRRLSEALHNEPAQELSPLRAAVLEANPPAELNGNQVVRAAKSAGTKAIKKIWHFMLEAKDLKQGKLLAAKISKIVPAKRAFNIGAHSTLKKAKRLYDQRDLEQAEQVYLSVIKKHPHEYDAYQGLVYIYLQQKNYKDVQQLLEHLISQNPDNDGYLAQLGTVLMQRRRFKEAVEAFVQSLKINDLSAARFANLALCYQAMNLLSAAHKNFQKALDLEPENMQYLVMFADLVLKESGAVEAIKILKPAADSHPTNVLVREKLFSLENETVS